MTPTDRNPGMQELIDRLAAEKAISEQDSEWLMYGACLPANPALGTDDPLAVEVEDLSSQASSTHVLSYLHV